MQSLWVTGKTKVSSCKELTFFMLSDWKVGDLIMGERRNDFIFWWKMLLKIFSLTWLFRVTCCLSLMQHIVSEKSTFHSVHF